MTVIAWDGKTLAADRRVEDGLLWGEVTKIRRFRKHLIGASGHDGMASRLQHWFCAGADIDQFPSQSSEHRATLLVITPDGRPLIYTSSPFPLEPESKHQAIGIGRDAAMAVMHLGLTAFRAVEVASAVCVGCGNGIDSLTLEGSEE